MQEPPISTPASTPLFGLLPDLAQHQTLYVALGVAVLVFVLAQRIPILRTVVNLVMTLALVGLLFVAIGQRSQFDPYLARSPSCCGSRTRRLSVARCGSECPPTGISGRGRGSTGSSAGC
ncbi:hypothetical protein [Sphingomonas sp. Ant20]|uniref:hypothetical protein n=1 Tax=Sphingomonas sp. Ant20 TaxID=104605 RepID=UPI002740C43A|nr:hypothetical protein [Sphingomonas sp. Ant20]